MFQCFCLSLLRVAPQQPMVLGLWPPLPMPHGCVRCLGLVPCGEEGFLAKEGSAEAE